jgi:predicted transglutaminase-like cysteine proteinase
VVVAYLPSLLQGLAKRCGDDRFPRLVNAWFRKAIDFYSLFESKWLCFSIFFCALALISAANIEPTSASAGLRGMPGDGKIGHTSIIFGAFGSLEFRTNGATSLAEWSRALQHMQSERPMYSACLSQTADCPAAVRAWRQKLGSLRGQDWRSQLKEINRFVNHAGHFQEDSDHFGRADVWQTPAEFLTSSGDCEDYAITKFFSLLELGFSNEQLRIVIVHDRQRKVDHAVVAVAEDDDIYILDSLFDAPARHENMLRYDPVYSVNLTSRFGHVVTPQIRDKFIAAMAEQGREKIDAPVALNAGAANLAMVVSDVAAEIVLRLWPANIQTLSA